MSYESSLRNTLSRHVLNFIKKKMQMQPTYFL